MDSPAQRRRGQGFRRASAGGGLAQLFIDQTDEFIGWVGPDARLLFGNPALCRALGYSQPEFSALHIWDVFPQMRESWPARWQEIKQGPQAFVAELHTRSGEILPARLHATYAAFEGKEFLLCRGGLDDGLPGRLLQLQDEERRRIARELHDTTGQNLAALSINLSLVLGTARIDSRTRDALNESIALVDSSVREIRAMSYLLHPPLLDELGLVSALRAYAEGRSIDLDLPLEMPRLPQPVEIALFRMVQEAAAAIVRLRHSLDRVELQLIGGATSGIATIRERAVQLGGRLTVASADAGTTLRVVLLLSHPQDLNTAIGRS